MSPHPASCNEWVEIIEPKSKKRIFANLESGICASSPPEGSIVSHSEDFSDHWWELYDNKTGKYYYYNPEQQKTAWTKPSESSSKKLLIIPVSRLQTNNNISKRLSPSSQDGTVEKIDASTQTIASNLVSTGTQTISESVLEKEFNSKFRLLDLSQDTSSQSSSSCTHQVDRKNKLNLNHRQWSDFNSKDRANYLKNRHQASNKNRFQIEPTVGEQQQLNAVTSNHQNVPLDQTDNFKSYFGPTSSFGNSNERKPISIQSPAHKISHRNSRSIDVGGGGHHYQCSTSTFAASSSSRPPPPPPIPPATTSGIKQLPKQQQQQITTNNLSHYLVREARAMGIALISDDDLDDDDEEEVQDSDEDVRDDTSSHPDLNASSQDLNGEDSSEGWKSFSDQDSPNSTAQNQNEFTFNELVDDEKNPSNCLSQQLDHRKLVENFKKSRQTSTLPRQRREKTVGGNIDADYDVVEENCGYYSDSEPLPLPVAMPNNSNISLDVYQTNDNSLPRVKPSQSPNNFDRYKSTRGSTFSVESFARENLVRHPKKGSLLFNRKVKWTRMISWTKSSIKQPMISSVSSDLNADSIASFKLIQQFMGDRKVNLTKNYRQILAQSVSSNETQQYQKDLKGKSSLTRSNSINTSGGSCGTGASAGSSSSTIPDRLRDELSYELVVKGCLKSPLRDEIFVQIARQLTDNPNPESVTWGLVLLSILLSYFSPSTKFAPFLLSFLESHTHQMARDVCLPRLEKRLRQNWLAYCRKPADGKEISIVRLSITKWPLYCGVFGESLEKIMSLQMCSPYLKTLRLPWILTTLGKKLIETGGLETEGIFRCAADHDLIAQLRLEIDCVDFRKITDAKQVHSLLSNVQDPHVIAGLLKLFFRQLYEPAFPSNIYDICLQNGQDGNMACRIFHEHLSNLNKDVVAYLIRLLQMLSKSDSVVAQTKMDSSNLSMVWAPNLLRLPQQQDSLSSSFGGLESKNGSKWSIANGNNNTNTTINNEDSIKSSQSLIFEQTRQEMQFIRNLIVHLDTSFIENVI